MDLKRKSCSVRSQLLSLFDIFTALKLEFILCLEDRSFSDSGAYVVARLVKDISKARRLGFHLVVFHGAQVGKLFLFFLYLVLCKIDLELLLFEHLLWHIVAHALK